jgi:hypothetical protein
VTTPGGSTGSTTTSSSTTTGSTTTGGSKSGSGSGTAKGESAVPTPSKPSKPKVVVHYLVTAQFGVVPPAPAPPQLKTYADMTVNEPIPAKDNPQLVFVGVVLSTGKDAVFALTGESILHGNATCVPSPTHCQAIELAAGQSETLESFEANGNAVTYELKLVSIARKVGSASAARARSASKRALSIGRELLRQAGVSALPGLRYPSVNGLLVPAGR